MCLFCATLFAIVLDIGSKKDESIILCSCMAEMDPFYKSIHLWWPVDQENRQNCRSQQKQWLADLFNKTNDLLTVHACLSALKRRV